VPLEGVVQLKNPVTPSVINPLPSGFKLNQLRYRVPGKRKKKEFK
jgi:hypothetical protein